MTSEGDHGDMVEIDVRLLQSVLERMHGTMRDRTESVRLVEHFQEVSRVLELVRDAACSVRDAATVPDALRTALHHICRIGDWSIGRVWRRARDDGEPVVATGISVGTAERDWPPPSSTVMRAIAERYVVAAETRRAPDSGVLLAAPVVVDTEVEYVFEFGDDDGRFPDELTEAAAASVCATVSLAIERERMARMRLDGDPRTALLVRHTDEAVLALDADLVVLYATPGAARLAGASAGPIAGMSLIGLVHPDHRERVRSLFAVDGDGRRHCETTIVAGEGSTIEVDITASALSDDAQYEGAWIVTVRDVTELRRAEEKVRDALSHDPLTGLSGWPLFLEQAQRALALAQRTGWSVAVLAVDIDQFHTVNDAYGREAGDRVLIAIADRLPASLRQHDLVARAADVTRLGADEFLLLCENIRDPADASAIAARVLQTIAGSIAVDGEHIAVTASIGIAISTTTSTSDSLVAYAEAAERSAKQGGGNRFAAFDREALATADDTLAAELRRGVAAGELVLVYQPKISLSTNRIVGVEALVRWAHPERGLIPPNEFIPVAERTGVVVAIGEWVLREAFRQTAVWRLAYPRTQLRVSVNVSTRQFRSAVAVRIREAADATGVDPTAVCLEMTETTVMDDIGHTVEILDELKLLGYSLSIDDFGTGYSSLEYLHRMPIDEVKIDGTFVAGLGIDDVNTAIVASVISLAHAMDIDVVAEGVETIDQLTRLEALGCDYAQGYAIARPLPAAEIDEFLAADAAGEQMPRTDDSAGIIRPAVAETVLVVDDTADVRMLAGMSVSAAGFSVEEAGNGAAGIALARRLVPDCILLDVTLPDMTGIEVCKILRNDPATAVCTIVMLTTHADPVDKAEAFLAGADDYIVKPFTPRDLVTRIRSALRRRHTAVGTVGRQVDAALVELLQTAREHGSAQADLSQTEQLSDRQIEILKRLLGGQRVPTIARELYLSQSTVRNHLSAIYRRLGVHSQEELIRVLRQRSEDLSRPR